MKSWSALALGAFALTNLAADWRIAEPGWHYEFPRDNHAHLEFKTEWWYFTGNLSDGAGRRFGYELTFFRHGIRPPSERVAEVSRFVVDDLKFAHFTVTDDAGRHFYFRQKQSRGAFGEAGFGSEDRLAWIESWNLAAKGDGSFDLAAESTEAKVRFHLRPEKPPTIHGDGGISQKAAGESHASHYYSVTRLQTSGSLSLGQKAFAVTGESWFDHEWATNQLAPEQAGWDWLSVQLDDRTELMLYRMRLANGSVDSASSGTIVRADGTSIHLKSDAFRMTPIKFWTSTKTSAKYPIGWRIEIPEQQLALSVQPLLDDQELALAPLTYWEGAVEVTGRKAGGAVSGRGYLELTGYAGRLHDL
jgi:predicted secreted hydrolase